MCIKHNFSVLFEFNLENYWKNWRHKIETHTVNLNKANRKERLCQWHVIISAMLRCDGAARSICPYCVLRTTQLTFRFRYTYTGTLAHTHTQSHTYHWCTIFLASDHLNAFNTYLYFDVSSFTNYLNVNFQIFPYNAFAAKRNYSVF